ncbi:MAG: 4-amino-4-deoxy-L-arabinose transferase-like glycosyltransferase [Gammaproteobacteria bacterium]|jgi:4-amino-4-deoxy-L-arabinose transferase-like glycosyltransferase
MPSPDQQHLPKREVLVCIIVATLTVPILQNLFFRMSDPTFDEFQYIDYALNIHDHGVFGLSGKYRDNVPAPEYINSPLYPALLAFTIWLDPELEAKLKCLIINRGSSGKTCPGNFRSIIVVQDVLVIGALVCLWLTAMLLYKRALVAWITCALVLASTKPLFFANHLLTEILILFFFACLMLGLVLALKHARRKCWPVIGAIIGLMTLTRPEYVYLAYLLTLLGIVIAVIRHSKPASTSLVLFIVAFCAILGPWVARNHHHFGQYAVTGGYSDIIISQRVAYNRMSPGEWTVAFLYWLPGHGETLTATLFPDADYSKLGTDPGSYYFTESVTLYDQGMADVGGDRDRLTGHLIRSEILDHPVRHLATSIPLAWRGILAGKYLAVPGLPCFVILVIASMRNRDWMFPILTLPALAMAGLYAGVSVSIPRYNVYLIYYYAIAVAWVLVFLIDRKRANS